MVRGHEQILDVIVLQGLHALDTLAATVLILEIIKSHTLDVALLGHSDNGILIGDDILHGNIVLVKADGCTSRIPVLGADSLNLISYYTEQDLLVAEDCLIFLNLFHKVGIFCFELFSFQAG